MLAAANANVARARPLLSTFSTPSFVQPLSSTDRLALVTAAAVAAWPTKTALSVFGHHTSSYAWSAAIDDAMNAWQRDHGHHQQQDSNQGSAPQQPQQHQASLSTASSSAASNSGYTAAPHFDMMHAAAQRRPSAVVGGAMYAPQQSPYFDAAFPLATPLPMDPTAGSGSHLAEHYYQAPSSRYAAAPPFVPVASANDQQYFGGSSVASSQRGHLMAHNLAAARPPPPSTAAASSSPSVYAHHHHQQQQQQAFPMDPPHTAPLLAASSYPPLPSYLGSGGVAAYHHDGVNATSNEAYAAYHQRPHTSSGVQMSGAYHLTGGGGGAVTGYNEPYESHRGGMAAASSSSSSAPSTTTTFFNPFDVKHRRRTTRSQFKVLEGTFAVTPKPSASTRKALSEQLDMPLRAVQIWFQNRRAKAKTQAAKGGGGGGGNGGGSSSTGTTSAGASGNAASGSAADRRATKFEPSSPLSSSSSSSPVVSMQSALQPSHQQQQQQYATMNISGMTRPGTASSYGAGSLYSLEDDEAQSTPRPAQYHQHQSSHAADMFKVPYSHPNTGSSGQYAEGGSETGAQLSFAFVPQQQQQQQQHRHTQQGQEDRNTSHGPSSSTSSSSSTHWR